MLIIEAGVFWRRVAKRFESRVNAKAHGVRPTEVHVMHSWLGLRVIMWAIVP